MPSGPHPARVLALLLLCLLLLLPPGGSAGSCPSVCLCTSDTVSCGASGLTRPPSSLPASSTALDLSYNHLTWLGPASFAEMPRLETLRLAHNQVTGLGHEVFHNVSHSLRQLDLSSNQLRVVEQHYFQGLWRLEELLLFNNRIARVEGGTLSGLSSLKKAYFSLNHITDFPFFSVRDHSHPFLAMLDLSSNRMSTLPWEDVKALPSLAQRGLYLHNNSLACDCSMYAVFWHWRLREYEPLRDFADQYTCTVAPGEPRANIRFLRHDRFFRNCSVERRGGDGEERRLPVTVLLSSLSVFEGERLHLDCQTSLSGTTTDLSFAWLTPGQGYVTESVTGGGGGVGDDNAGVIMSLFANGTLEVHAARLNDSGLYVCTASAADSSSKKQPGTNATREVNVTVSRHAPEPFSEGYTTLIGCAVTMVLILVYLYLTPCRCGCCKQPQLPQLDPLHAGGRSSRSASAASVGAYEPNSSSLCPMFSSSSSVTRPKPDGGRHVAFIEPEELNGRLKAGAADYPPPQWEWEATPGLTITPFTAAIIEI